MLLSGAHCANVVRRFPDLRDLLAAKNLRQNNGFAPAIQKILKLPEINYLNY